MLSLSSSTFHDSSLLLIGHIGKLGRDLYPQEFSGFALSPRYARGSLPVAMANALKDALFVSCAAHDLDLFTEFDPQQLELLMEALRDIDVESCSDFRFAFVTSDKVDASAVKEFAKGDL